MSIRRVILFGIVGTLLAGCGPKSPAPAGSDSDSPAKSHYQNGVQLAQQGKMAGAETEWKTAIGLDPAFNPPYLALAAKAEAAGNLKGAVEQFKFLRKADPNAHHVECRIADLYFRSGHFVSTLEVARDAVRREPDCPLAQTILGMTLANADDKPDALVALLTAHKLAPADDRLTLSLAQLLAQSGRAEEAFPLVESTLPRLEAHLQADYLLGWLWAEYGRGGKPDPQQAIAYLKKALVIDPDHAASNSELGVLLARQGQYAEARPYLERAQKKGAFDLEAVRAYAAVAEHLSLPDAAKIRQAAVQFAQIEAETKRVRNRYLTHPEENANTLALARLEANRGNTADGLELVKEALRRDPNDPQALAILHRFIVPAKKR